MRETNIQMSRKMLGNALLYPWGSFSIPDLCVGASFDFVEDLAVLDEQQGHSSSIYALFAICSPDTGWKISWLNTIRKAVAISWDCCSGK